MVSGNSKQSVSGKDHLLIIRFSAMGDVAMLVPVLRILHDTYPGIKITVLTRDFFAPVFQDIPGLVVHVADLKGRHKGIPGLIKLSRELKGLGITAVGDMHNVLRSNILKVLFLFSGIRFKQIDKGRAEKKALISIKNKVFRQLKTTHQRYADVLSELGYPVDPGQAVFPEKYDLSPEITEITGVKMGPWVGIAPFAAHEAKAYPVNLLAQVLENLSTQGDQKIFLFGGGAREAKKLDSLASGYDNIQSLAGKLEFKDELKVISNLDLMVSMDSGNAHLAAMYGVRVLTIWGVTHPFAGFAAYNQPRDHHILPDLSQFPAIPTSIYGNKYPAGYERVMESIPPHAIVEKIQDLLALNKKNG